MEDKYMLVEFVDDNGKKSSIDVVPASWIFFDEKQKSLVTPFASDMSKSSLRILNDLVKSEGEPLQSWSTHRISVRGSAKSYSEADKKAKDLETKAYAFTTDQEEHVETRKHQIAERYKLKGTKCNEQKVAGLFAKAAVEIKAPGKRIKASKMTKKSPTVKTGKLSRKCLISPLTSKKKRGMKEDFPSKYARKKKKMYKSDSSARTSNTDESGSTSDGTDSEGVVNGEKSDRSSLSDKNNNGASTSSFNHKDSATVSRKAASQKKTVDNSPGRGKVDDKNNNGASTSSFDHDDSATFSRKAASREETVDDSPGRGKVDSEFFKILQQKESCSVSAYRPADAIQELRKIIIESCCRLSSQIGQLQSQIVELKVTQRESIASKKGSAMKSIDAIMEAYELSPLPFPSLQDFLEFDKKLTNDKKFKNEMIQGLTTFIHADPKFLLKSVRDVVKKFMTREVLINCTSVKKTGTKIVFKDETQFYHCLRDAILTEYSRGTLGSVKEKDITDALSAVINTAKDWGCREERRQKKN